MSSDLTSSPVGLTGVTVGVYLALAGVPFLSTRWTSIPVACPVNCGSGWNLILPFGSIVYVPSPSTVTESTGFPVFGSINFVEVSSIGTLGSPSVNVGVPNWAFPCISVVLAGVAVGLIGVIFGVYVVVTGVPFLSFAWIVTGWTVPTYVLSVGVNTAVGFPSTTFSV